MSEPGEVVGVEVLLLDVLVEDGHGGCGDPVGCRVLGVGDDNVVGVAEGEGEGVSGGFGGGVEAVVLAGVDEVEGGEAEGGGPCEGGLVADVDPVLDVVLGAYVGLDFVEGGAGPEEVDGVEEISTHEGVVLGVLGHEERDVVVSRGIVILSPQLAVITCRPFRTSKSLKTKSLNGRILHLSYILRHVKSADLPLIGMASTANASMRPGLAHQNWPVILIHEGENEDVDGV